MGRELLLFAKLNTLFLIRQTLGCSLPYVYEEDGKGDKNDGRDETIGIFYYVLRLW